jgi:S-adenosylmethionine:tRNA ribosyltransferase-isomerase
MSERCSDYDYEVPPSAIAQEPCARRDGARLLLVERRGADLADGAIAELPARLRPGDLLVLNEARVLPARLLARRTSGGRVSVLVLRVEAGGRRAAVLLGARGTVLAGERLDVAGDRWAVVRASGEGRFEIEVERGRELPALLADIGRMPLPPYIERGEAGDPRDALDRERYQTVYARPAQKGGAHAGPAVAAPTAGLHFTPELLAAVAARGVEIARLSLAVGEGTFRPLRGETLDEHAMHAERFEIPETLASAYAAARARGGRVVAVGTTVVRALESSVEECGRALRPGAAETALFIRPGHEFRALDALLTNFHQPRSTLLVLVSAFAGLERMRAAYRHALQGGYRLFSYGDAMLIE